MKKVLFIAYYYPPLGGIGSQRSQKFAYYLPDFGWHPVVLTPEHGSYMKDESLAIGEEKGVKVVRTPTLDISSLLKRALPKQESETKATAPLTSSAPPATTSVGSGNQMTHMLRSLVRTWLYIPDGQIGWMPYAVRTGKRVLRSQRIDAIYSTSFPVTAHLIAYQLKLATGKPWIADFRDLFSEYHYADYSHPVRKQIDRMLEAKLFDHTDAIVTVSDTWADTLRRLTHGRKRVEVIRNGFDSNEFKGLTPTQPTQWTITYVGLFHGKRQDPTPFLEALKRLIENDKINRADVVFKIVGEPEPYVQNLVQQLELDDITHFTGFVPYRESLQHQLDSSLLLLIVPGEQANEGHVPGKIYEYLGARRPILALIPPHFEAARIIQQTGAGHAVDKNDATGIEHSLLESYQVFKQAQPALTLDADLSSYERVHETQQLADLLNDLTISSRQI